MGNPLRCPRCNGLGNKELVYCSRCDKQMFEEKLNALLFGSRKILEGALLELGANNLNAVKREERSRLLNIIKRRQPLKRRRSMVQGDAPLESYGYNFMSEPKDYSAEKEAPDIESVE